MDSLAFLRRSPSAFSIGLKGTFLRLVVGLWRDLAGLIDGSAFEEHGGRLPEGASRFGGSP